MDCLIIEYVNITECPLEKLLIQLKQKINLGGCYFIVRTNSNGIVAILELSDAKHLSKKKKNEHGEFKTKDLSVLNEIGDNHCPTIVDVFNWDLSGNRAFGLRRVSKEILTNVPGMELIS